MKIHLILAPPQAKARFSSVMYNNYPPLGILYIAGHLRKYGQDLILKVTDGLLEGWEKTIKEIDEFSPDVIFVSFATSFALSAYQLVNQIKADHPSILVAVGGPHASALPYEAFELSKCDFVVAGEGEQTALELVDAIANNRSMDGVNGVYWRDGRNVVANPPRDFIKNLDDIPFPARDLLDIKKYKGWFYVKNPPETTVLFSRGCPINCNFCSNVVWKSSKPWLRLRSPKNIVDEMEYLKDKFSISAFFDAGDEFNNHVPHATAICREIIRRKLKVTLRASIRAHPLPEELVSLMAEAGCWWVQLGIESGNQPTLDGIGKQITLRQVENALGLLKRYHINVFGLFMLFHFWEDDGLLRYEDISEALKTVAYAKKLIDKKLLSYISSNITTPYPGSQLFGIAERHGLFRSELYKRWDKWLAEDDFIVNIPGVSLRDAGNVYFKASLLRSYCYLRSGNWRLEDIPLLVSRFGRVLRIKAISFIH